MKLEQLVELEMNQMIADVQHSEVGDSDVFFSEGWTVFNEIKWGVTSKKVHINGNETNQPSLEVNLFLNKQGKIVRPPMNPYLPIRFKTTSTSNKFRQNAQWLSICKSLMHEFSEHDLSNTIFLPTQIVDIRPWQWAGLRTSVRYTYVVEFPYNLGQADTEVRRKINKAQKHGYVCERTTNMRHVFECLLETETRQGFTHQLTLADLELALELISEDHLLAYVAYTPSGEPVSAEIILYSPGGYGYGWACGNKKEHLKNGVNQYLMHFAMEDLKSNCAKGLDLCGANIPSVAQAKMSWGVNVKPYYTIDSFSIQTLTKWSRDWIRYARKKGEKS